MKCEWVQENILLYVYNELADDARCPVRHHPAARPRLVGPLVVDVVGGVGCTRSEAAGVVRQHRSATLLGVEVAELPRHRPEGEPHDDAGTP